jgi:glyoxylase-like metal-dependent hydrolase (beta-lactamase superfamily II)
MARPNGGEGLNPSVALAGLGSRVILRQYKTGRLANFTYLIAGDGGGEAAVIDPHADVGRLASEAAALGLEVRWIFNTHSHWDHTMGNAEMAKLTGARVVQHERSPGPRDVAVAEGEILEVGGLPVRVLHTPGHTPDSICLIADRCLFTGDTLFIGECGRVDLPGSDPGAMYESLLVKIRGLPDDLEVYPGHDYGPVPHAPLGQEKATNYTLKPRSREEFLRFIQEP